MSQYDDQGRPYTTHVFSVGPSNGDVSTDSIDTYTWYDHRGNVIKTQSAGQAATKTAYDGEGRSVVTYTTDASDDTPAATRGTWDDATNITGDIVLEQQESKYDDDGNVIESIDRQRFHDDASGDTGALGGPTSTNAARVYYTTSYFDAADRDIADVNVGTNGGSPYTRPSTIPSRSDTVLVSSTTYNPAGWVDEVTDPRGIIAKTIYDNAGRTTSTIAENSEGDSP